MYLAALVVAECVIYLSLVRPPRGSTTIFIVMVTGQIHEEVQ